MAPIVTWAKSLDNESMLNGDKLQEIIDQKQTSALQVGYWDGQTDSIVSLGDAQDSSLFDIASVSKVLLTTNLIMRLVDANELRLEQVLGEFFPSISNDKKSLSLIDLLTHTSGLRAWIPFYFSNENWLTQINQYRLESMPGEARIYSDVGFVILGKVIEKVCGESLDLVFQKEIASSLKLQNTFFEQDCPKERAIPTSIGNPFEKNLAKKMGYKEPENFSWRKYRICGETNDFNCHQFFNGVSGHCGLFSNCFDLLKITKDLISHTQFLAFTQKVVCKNSLGFLNQKDYLKFQFSEKTVGHHGFTGCSVFLDQSCNKIFIYLSNRQFFGLDEKKDYPSWKDSLQSLI